MRTTAIVAGSLILLAAGALVAWRYFGPWPANLTGPSRTGNDEPTATYVGARACAGEHRLLPIAHCRLPKAVSILLWRKASAEDCCFASPV